ncbi:28S ribosomal protein S35, mitochondrial [Contarinia nasturtii]|uniref:28S ribosomal protein S35, mitochondrial n=1 Tax=Contarinia nasturtii TaxID=265458 RepID=UPI0012D49C2F|nr:28S ribosomal protein S35, mitochondrial [Contarinia nasturtii]
MFSLACKQFTNINQLQKIIASNSIVAIRNCSVVDNSSKENIEQKEFRVLDLNPKKDAELIRKRRVVSYNVPDHRFKKMSVRQKWGNVWPGPKTFHPSVVPLPLRQGFVYNTKKNSPPQKFGNAELMKIPNFLHLTPPVIKQQCEAIKKYCTPWPAGLETDEKCDKHFPIEFISTDYCHGLPTIRNPLSRIISLRFKLSALPFDEHARDKFLRLVENRYNPETDLVTITVDRCPVRKQNFEYAQYLLTALFHESFIVEPWESLKIEVDMEYYDWQKNKSKESIEAILRWGKTKDEPIKSTDAYAKSVEKIFNEGENQQNLQQYKEEVLKLLELKN